MNNASKLIPIAVASALAVALAAPAAAQSAKFAATYDTDTVMIGAAIDGFDGAADDGPNMVTEYELARLHVPQQKELLIGVSGQVQLVTFTQAKGRNKGGEAKAIADGGVGLEVAVVPEGTGPIQACQEGPFAEPGPITFASRVQELAVEVNLEVVDVGECDEDCIADLLDIEGDVRVALGLDTTAAHHFNFIAPDLDQGWYEIVACYNLTALAEVAGLDIDEDTAANSAVTLGPRVLTVQEVRATKNGIIDEGS